MIVDGGDLPDGHIPAEYVAGEEGCTVLTCSHEAVVNWARGAGVLGRLQQLTERRSVAWSVLRGRPLLSGCSDAFLDLVVQMVRTTSAKRDAVVTLEGAPADQLVIVSEGTVEATAGASRVVVATLGPGSVFGEMALVRVVKSIARLKVVSMEAELFILDKIDFLSCLEAFPAHRETLGFALADIALRREQTISPLVTAVRSGDRKKCEQVLQASMVNKLRKEQVNARDDGGWSSVHEAARAGHAKLLAYLLDLGGHLDAPTGAGQSPLHLAAAAGQLETVALLTQRGAFVSCVDEDGNTPMHAAVTCTDEAAALAILSNLAEHGAKPVVANVAGNTPLHLACNLGRLECVRLFLRLGASVDARSVIGSTPMHEAALSGNPAVIGDLARAGAVVDASDHEFSTPLQYAANMGGALAVRELLGAGANPNFRDMHEHTPLHHAAYEGDKESIGQLLSAGGNVRLRGENGMLPFMFAAAASHQEAAKVLMVVEPRAITAVRQGKLADLKASLAEAAAPDVPPKRALEMLSFEGWGPLHEAAARGRREFVAAVLQHAAELEQQQRQQQQEGTTTTTTTTTGAAGDGNDAESVRARAAVKRLFDLSAASDQGQTPLQLAAATHSPDFLRYLLENGAQKSIDTPNSLKRTPLMMAAKNGKADNCRVLLRAGASLAGTDVHGRGVLDYAARGRVSLEPMYVPAAEMVLLKACYARDLPAVEAALSHGADPDTPDYWGRTPLQAAMLTGWTEAVQALLDAGASPGLAFPAVPAADMGGPTWAEAAGLEYPIILAMGPHPPYPGDRSVAHRLLNSNAPVTSAVSRSGVTALHLAALYDDADVIGAVFRRESGNEGFQPAQLKDNHMATPLHIAAERGCSAAVNALLAGVSQMVQGPGPGKFRALVEALNQDGKTAEALARAAGHTHTAGIIANAVAQRALPAERKARAGVPGGSAGATSRLAGNSSRLAVNSRMGVVDSRLSNLDGLPSGLQRRAHAITGGGGSSGFGGRGSRSDAGSVISSGRGSVAPPPSSRQLAREGHRAEDPKFLGAYHQPEPKGMAVIKGARLSNMLWSHDTLVDACHAGNPGSVRRNLAARVDPDGLSSKGVTPLAAAVAAKSEKVVFLLLQAGADPNLPNADSQTPLHEACRVAHAGLVKILLDAGALPGPLDRNKRAPLHLAAQARPQSDARGAMVNFLLAAGADVNIADEDGNIPLHHACNSGTASAAEILLAYGARPKIRNRARQSAFDCAIAASNYEVAAVIADVDDLAAVVRKANATSLETLQNIARGALSLSTARTPSAPAGNNNNNNNNNNNGNNSISNNGRSKKKGVNLSNMDSASSLTLSSANLGAMAGSMTGLMKPVRAGDGGDNDKGNGNGSGTSPLEIFSGRTVDGSTLLHVAVAAESAPVTEFLLTRAGVPVDLRDAGGLTPLQAFCCKGANGGVAELLIRAGADLEAVDSEGLGLLHYVSKFGSAAGAEVLLKHGASPNKLDSTPLRWTPLHYAAKNGSLACIKALLAKGARKGEVDSEGKRPYDLAAQARHAVCAALLAPVDALLDLLREGKYDPLCQLIQDGASVNDLTSEGSTLLHEAVAREGGEKMTGFLLLHRADANMRESRNSWTPLHVACATGGSACLPLLLPRVRSINARDSRRRTALHVACEKGDYACIEVLGSAGARLDYGNELLRTPLHEAALSGSLDAVSALLSLGATARLQDKDGRTAADLARDAGHAAIAEAIEARIAQDPVALAAAAAAAAAAAMSPEEARALAEEQAREREYHLLMSVYGREAQSEIERALAMEPPKELREATVEEVGEQPPILARDDETGAVVSEEPAPIHEAVRFNRFEVLDSLLRSKPALEVPDAEGATPLHIAARFDRLHCLELLLGHGASTATVDGQLGRTALHIAAEGGFHGCLAALVSTRGAAVDPKDGRGHTPLHIASAVGNAACVEELMAHGADTLVKDSLDHTPLHLAAASGSAACCELLLRRPGAEGKELKGALDAQGRSAFDIARDKGHWPAMLVLATLNELIELGDVARVEERLLQGESAAETDESGKTAIAAAAHTNLLGVARLLVSNGADPKAPDHAGITPLHIAAALGHTEMVQLLLSSFKVPVDPRDLAADRTPLHMASANGFPLVVGQLLRAGASVRSSDAYLCEPLHLAAGGGHLDTCWELLLGGASLTAMRLDSRTPADVAAAAPHHDVERFLRHCESRGVPPRKKSDQQSDQQQQALRQQQLLQQQQQQQAHDLAAAAAAPSRGNAPYLARMQALREGKPLLKLPAITRSAPATPEASPFSGGGRKHGIGARRIFTAGYEDMVQRPDPRAASDYISPLAQCQFNHARKPFSYVYHHFCGNMHHDHHHHHHHHQEQQALKPRPPKTPKSSKV